MEKQKFEYLENEKTFLDYEWNNQTLHFYGKLNNARFKNVMN